MWPEIKTDYERLKDDVHCFLNKNLRSIISEDYVYDIRRAIIDDVVAAVVETSAFKEKGTWNDDDIKLAVGLVLFKKVWA